MSYHIFLIVLWPNVERADGAWSQRSGDYPEFVWRAVVGVPVLWSLFRSIMTQVFCAVKIGIYLSSGGDISSSPLPGVEQPEIHSYAVGAAAVELQHG